MIKAEIKDRIISLKTPFSHRDKCVAVRGGIWSKSRQQWEWQLTPATAKSIIEVFGLKEFDDNTTRILIGLATNIVSAEASKNGHLISPIPVTKVTPWKHQTVAWNIASHLLGLSTGIRGGGCLLAMDMGTGKSKVVMDLINNYPDELKTTIIACPKKVIEVWVGTAVKMGQIESHAAIPVNWVSLENGTIAQRLDRWFSYPRGKTPLIGVINYEAIWRDAFADWLLKNPPDMVVVDEGHRIKDPSGRTSRFFSHLSRVVPYRIAPTGTPTPHSPMDAFGLYRFLDTGVFGRSYMHFRSRYAYMGGYNNKQILSYINMDEFSNRLWSIGYRVKAKDVLDLPPFQDMTITFDLDREERKAYDEMEQQFITEVNDEVITASNALAKLLRLQQITSGFIADRLQIGKSKELELADLLEDFEEREPIVIFARFKHDLERIKKVVEKSGRRYGELSGTSDDRGAWDTGAVDVLGVQIQSGKEGVDFTRSRYSIYYSLGFSLGDYNQSRARLDRPGQTRPGMYIHLVAERTVDVKIMKSLEKNEKIIEGVLAQYKEER